MTASQMAAKDFSKSTVNALARKGLYFVNVTGLQEADGLTAIYHLSDGRALRFTEVKALLA